MKLRSFDSSIPKRALVGLQNGSLRYTYRGVTFRKNPLDIALYMKLLHELKPMAIIEIGTLHGGSALWFADQLSTFGIDGHVYSVDIARPPKIDDPRITFLQGDAMALENSSLNDLMESIRGPILVIEDSSHLYEASLAVLNYFHQHLSRGDYIVIEDGIVNDLRGRRYRRYRDGPNRAVRKFLDKHHSDYEIDASICDFFGQNYTFNPNGYLKRVV